VLLVTTRSWGGIVSAPPALALSKNWLSKEGVLKAPFSRD
jgi:hypothetical protein